MILLSLALAILAAAILFHTLAHSAAAPAIHLAIKELLMDISTRAATAIAAFQAKTGGAEATIADLKAQLEGAAADLEGAKAAHQADLEAWERAAGVFVELERESVPADPQPEAAAAEGEAPAESSARAVAMAAETTTDMAAGLTAAVGPPPPGAGTQVTTLRPAKEALWAILLAMPISGAMVCAAMAALALGVWPAAVAADRVHALCWLGLASQACLISLNLALASPYLGSVKGSAGPVNFDVQGRT